MAARAVADDLTWSLKLEGGSEFDTNIHRFEDTGADDVVADDVVNDIESAPVARGGARLQTAWRPGKRHRAGLMAFAGGKLYGTETGQDENVIIVAGDGQHHWSLPRRSAALGARATYYDTLGYRPGGGEPRVEPRHFSMAGAELALTLLGPDQHRLVMTGGYRRFRYKPSDYFHWSGDVYGLRYQTTTWRGDPDTDLDAASMDIIVSYELERRGYQGDALTNICPPDQQPQPQCVSPLTGTARADLHHAGAAELLYTGDRIYSARYELSVTDSNSFGQSLVRQRLELGVTTELAARVFVTAKAALQLDIFLDTLLLARDVNAQDFTTIDDENRNSVSIHLARDITRAWTLEGRYALFTNEFATQESTFRRQVFYLGVVYQYQP
jgi:hypothetical protein